MGKRSLGRVSGSFLDISDGGDTLGQAETQCGGVPDSNAAHHLAAMVAFGRIDAYWRTNDKLVAWVRVGVSGQEDLKSD